MRMKPLALVAAAAALTVAHTGAAPAAAQSAQSRLDSRYDRALAAGYKALFLCSAISHAEANGTTRSEQSVHEWELTGIQQPLDTIIRDREYDVLRHDNGTVERVWVRWDDNRHIHNPNRNLCGKGVGYVTCCPCHG